MTNSIQEKNKINCIFYGTIYIPRLLGLLKTSIKLLFSIMNIFHLYQDKNRLFLLKTMVFIENKDFI